jgi:hypothetical protein
MIWNTQLRPMRAVRRSDSNNASFAVGEIATASISSIDGNGFITARNATSGIVTQG